MKKIVFMLLVSFAFLSPVFAAQSSCDYETQLKLQKAALDVKVTYEADEFGTGEFENSEITDEFGEPEQYEITEPRVDVSIYNITEDIYVTVEDKETNQTETYYYEDTVDGTITWSREDLENIVEYEVKIFSNISSCAGEELNKMSIVTPKLNDYSYQNYCAGVNKYYCQEFITQEVNMSEEEVRKSGYEAQMETEEEAEKKEKENNFWEKNKWYIIASVIIVSVGVVAAVIIIKQRRKVL